MDTATTWRNTDGKPAQAKTGVHARAKPDKSTGPGSQTTGPLTEYRIHGVTDLERQTIQEVKQAGGLRRKTIHTYHTLWSVYERWCTRTGQVALDYSAGKAERFVAHLLTQAAMKSRPCHNIRPYFTAMNYHFSQRGYGNPWRTNAVRSLCKGYERAQATRSLRKGVDPPNRRVACPPSVIERTLNPTDQQLPWAAVSLVCLLTGIRADSAGMLRPQNIRFMNGCLVVDVLRCKTASEPRTKVVPAPATEQHPRHRAFQVIRAGSQRFDADLFGTNPSVSITKAMQTFVSGDLAPGTFVSSHSWRKAGASILHIMNVSMLRIIAYGGWSANARSLQSIIRYVDHQYIPTLLVQQLMDGYAPQQ